LWQVLSDAGLRVGAIGVPQTYPVAPVNGHMVSCFLTPNARSQFTFPPELKSEITGWIDGDEFLVDVPNFRSEDKDRILVDIYRMADQHFTVCERLLERERYDFFMTVDMGVDRIHHAFWKYMDPKHPKHEPGNRFEAAIHDYYVHIDRRVGRLLELAGDDTTVFVVSDHGAKAMLGGVCINEWLIAHGWLVLEETPTTPTPLERCSIDWSRTRAWGEGGYYGRLFLNVAGREPQGVIAPEDYEAERSRLVEELSALTDHEGKPLQVDAYRPEDVYAEVTNVAPERRHRLGVDVRERHRTRRRQPRPARHLHPPRPVRPWRREGAGGPAALRRDAHHPVHARPAGARGHPGGGDRPMTDRPEDEVQPGEETAAEDVYSEEEEEEVEQRLRDLGSL
jgi:predicted AlkP superfamily phosphohydrolase/phosphomutase